MNIKKEIEDNTELAQELDRYGYHEDDRKLFIDCNHKHSDGSSALLPVVSYNENGNTILMECSICHESYRFIKSKNTPREVINEFLEIVHLIKFLYYDLGIDFDELKK